MSALKELSSLDLAALVASRVCHDIISPVGAITNGLEVLDEEGSEDMREFAMDLIRKSARQASAKLQFARLAFGAAGSAGAEIDLGDAETVASAYMKGEKPEFEWQGPRVLMAKNRVKLLLNLILLAVAAVPRGQVDSRIDQIRGRCLDAGLDSEIVDDGPIGEDEGNRFPNTPEHSASLWTTYDLGSVMLGVGANYVDQRFGNTGNTVWVPSYTTYDAMASFVISDRTLLQVNLQNLTDEVYYVRPYASHYASLGPSRSAVLSATIQF